MRQHVRMIQVDGRNCPLSEFKEWWGYKQTAYRCGSSAFFSKKALKKNRRAAV